MVSRVSHGPNSTMPGHRAPPLGDRQRTPFLALFWHLVGAGLFWFRIRSKESPLRSRTEPKNLSNPTLASGWSTIRLFLTALLIIAFGLTALIWRSGHPIVVGDESTLQVIETAEGVPWIGDEWQLVKPGETRIAWPLIHHVHRMNRSLETISLRTVAQTQSGLEVEIRALSVRYEVPPNGAIELIKHIGPNHGQLDTFVRETAIVAIRALLADTPDATSGVPIDQDQLEARLEQSLSDRLAIVGVEVRTVHIGGLRYEARTETLIGRLKAARSRNRAAENARREEQARHVKALQQIDIDGRALIETTQAQFEPLIEQERNDGRRVVDDLEFERRRLSIQRKTLRVRAEAWAYSDETSRSPWTAVEASTRSTHLSSSRNRPLDLRTI